MECERLRVIGDSREWVETEENGRRQNRVDETAGSGRRQKRVGGDRFESNNS